MTGRRSAVVAAVLGCALACGAPARAAGKAPPAGTLDVVWTIDTTGYGGYSKLVIRDTVDVVPVDFVIVGRPDLEVLYKLVRTESRLVTADAVFAGDRAEYRAAGPGEGGIALAAGGPGASGVGGDRDEDAFPLGNYLPSGATGVVWRNRKSGRIEFILGPGLNPLPVSGPADEAAGCWGEFPEVTMTEAEWRTIATQPLKAFTRSVSLPEAPECAGTMRVEVRVKVEEVEAVLWAEAAYQKWRPAGDRAGEDYGGRFLKVFAKLHPKGKPEGSTEKKATFRFELQDVSAEPGVCMNWPQKKLAKRTPDLAFEQSLNSDLRVDPAWSAASGPAGPTATSREPAGEAAATVTSFDFGAFGALRVVAELEEGGEVVASLKGEPEKRRLAIPKDDNENEIADDWEVGVRFAPRAEADEDFFMQGDGHHGDGLSQYEEYRGFMIKGTHQRTEAAFQDLFVHDPDHLGLGRFAEASRLTVHRVARDEFAYDIEGGAANPAVINFNRGHANLGQQHLILMRDASLPGDFGYAEGGPATPKRIQTVWVNRTACLWAGGQAQLDATIAHELAHACNVWHHGDLNYDVPEVWQDLAPGGWTPLGTGQWYVAAPRGQNSGVEECIMRYESAWYYERPDGGYRWRDPAAPSHFTRGEKYGPPERPGAIFCESRIGTGVNAEGHKPVPKAGDALKGNCQAQLCVNDLKH